MTAPKINLADPKPVACPGPDDAHPCGERVNLRVIDVSRTGRGTPRKLRCLACGTTFISREVYERRFSGSLRDLFPPDVTRPRLSRKPG